MDHKKLITTAKNLDNLAKFVSGFMLAFAIVFSVFAVLVLLLGSKVFQPGSLSLDLDFVKLHLSQDYQAVTAMTRAYAIVGLLAGSILCLAIQRGLKYFQNILQPMKEGRPFADSVPENLKKIAWTVLFGGVFLQITAVAERILLTKSFPIEKILSSPAVAKIEYIYTMDFGFVLTFCIIMFLSYIFRYGQQLQRESDETL